ncbi:MAG: phosphatidate cytidylyltransferase [Proteobacteria bacterium]|nr:phosphatidate cytidylyltransferase [Pseudomonadota bacterium]
MKSELFYRILTSVILLPILFLATFYSEIYLILLLLLFYFLSMYEIIKNTTNLLFIFFSLILLFFSFYSFYILRGDTVSSLIIIYWILISTFLSDVGGYSFGKIFKGRKITKISPNKTYSGVLGSFLLSCLSIPLMNLLQLILLKKTIINFLELNFLIITILISLVCQIGDLFVSFLKRKINIKNISNMLPGHGGILDRIDGLIFVLLFAFILRFFLII